MTVKTCFHRDGEEDEGGRGQKMPMSEGSGISYGNWTTDITVSGEQSGLTDEAPGQLH